MGAVLIALGILVTFFKPQIAKNVKGIESYAISIENPKIGYTLSAKDKDEVDTSLPDISYEPNVHSFTGLSFGHEYVTLSVTVQNKDDDKLDVEASETFDIQMFGHFKNHLWELYYQNYQGLYIVDDPTLLASDLPTANSWSYGGTMKRFTRKSFKIKNSYSYFSKNKRSNWSWVQGASIGKSRLYTSDSLIPTKYEANYTQLVGLKAIETSTLGLDFGITGLYTFNRFFINGLVSVGINLQKQEFSGIETEDRTLTDGVYSTSIDLGYDSKKSGSIGLSARMSGYTIPVKNAQFQMARSITTLYYKYFF